MDPLASQKLQDRHIQQQPEFLHSETGGSEITDSEETPAQAAGSSG
jgi:hypothetical protein